jgi:hypothetical protein
MASNIETPPMDRGDAWAKIRAGMVGARSLSVLLALAIGARFF